MDKLHARAIERAEIIDRIARMLWESGEETADWEGGQAPTWDMLTAARNAPDTADPLSVAYIGYWLTAKADAEAILRLDASQSLVLAQILIASAARQHAQMELDLWRKVERAKGFEPGSLTGAAGVKQRVAL